MNCYLQLMKMIYYLAFFMHTVNVLGVKYGDKFIRRHDSKMVNAVAVSDSATISQCAQQCMPQNKGGLSGCISYSYNTQTKECSISDLEPVSVEDSSKSQHIYRYVPDCSCMNLTRSMDMMPSNWEPVTADGQIYQYGTEANDTLIPKSDDRCELSYNQSITIYGTTFPEIFVCPNGVVSFNTSITAYKPVVDPPPSKTMIAAYWADGTFRQGGSHWSRLVQGAESCTLRELSQKVNRVFVTDFKAEWAMITTWDQVRAYSGRRNDLGNNTFQMVIASDDVDTYVTLIYDELMWPNVEKPEQVAVGFLNGTDVFELPYSMMNISVTQLQNNSNIDIKGHWMFKVTESTVEPPPERKEECLDLCNGRGSCGGGLNPHCHCENGFEGEFCQYDEAGHCASSPCGSQTCTDLMDDYCCS